MARLSLKKRLVRGASMAEYALLLALIAVIAIAMLTLLGGNVNAAFTAINNGFAGAGF